MEKYNVMDRMSTNDINGLKARLDSHRYLMDILNSLPVWVLILTQTRQIVYFNDTLSRSLGCPENEKILSLRPGEVFNCINCSDQEYACGTTKLCKYCGAFKSIMSSVFGNPKREECNLVQMINGEVRNLTLDVSSTPIYIDKMRLNMFVVQDVSQSKLRLNLMQSFLHDIRNTTSAIIANTQLIEIEQNVNDKIELLGLLKPSAYQLLDEIDSQTLIELTDSGQWETIIKSTSSAKIIKECISLCNFYISDATISIHAGCINDNPINLKTDVSLLKRVLINMLKNALESAEIGETVQIKCERISDKLAKFSVKNNKLIPIEHQKNIFVRSFSTKGSNRGLGTYGIKLLTTKYLQGQASFISDEEHRTIFEIIIPVELKTIKTSPKSYKI